MNVDIGKNFPLKPSKRNVKVFQDPTIPPNRFTPKKIDGTFFSGIEIGRYFNLRNKYIKRIGVGFNVQIGKAKEQGSVWDLGLSDQYIYSTEMHFVSLLTLVHLQLFNSDAYKFNISGFLGFGPSYNSFLNYNEIPDQGMPSRTYALQQI